jgi:hypothetical protein
VFGVVIPMLMMPASHGTRNENLDQLAEEFFAPVTEHLLGSGVQKHNRAIALHLDDAVGSGFKKIPEAPVRLNVDARFFLDGLFGNRLLLALVITSTRVRIASAQDLPPLPEYGIT